MRDRTIAQLLRLASCALVAALTGAMICSCGGGSAGAGSNGDGAGTGEAPTIADLTYSPSAAFQSSNGVVTITGTVAFAAPSGNLATLRLTTSAGADLASPIPDAFGKTAGQLTGQVNVSSEIVGHYTFEIWVVDGNGNSSNRLAGSFEVLPNVGTSWTRLVSPTGADLHRAAWSGTRFVAVGASGAIVTSDDGVAWNSVASGTTNSLNGVAWIENQFVAVGEHGTVLMSLDGTTWTAAASPAADVSLRAVAGAGPLIVVAGGSEVFTSSDGAIWTKRVSSTPGWIFNGLARSGTVFVAIGWDTLSGSGPVTFWTSVDGTTWSSEAVGSSVTPYLFDIIWSGSKFVAVGWGTGAISTDGTNWKLFGMNVAGVTTFPAFGLSASGVASDGQMFLSVGDVWSQVERSADGSNWNEFISTPALDAVNGIAWGNGRFVVVGQSGAIFTTP